MEVYPEYFREMSKRADEIFEFAKKMGWTEDELRQTLELAERMIRISNS